MTVQRFDLFIEAKEDETADGIQPSLPDPAAAAQRLTDVLADVTKHDSMTGWRVTRVMPVAAGTAVVSAADLRAVLGALEQGRGLTLPLTAMDELRAQLAQQGA